MKSWMKTYHRPVAGLKVINCWVVKQFESIVKAFIFPSSGGGVAARTKIRNCAQTGWSVNLRCVVCWTTPAAPFKGTEIILYGASTPPLEEGNVGGFDNTFKLT